MLLETKRRKKAAKRTPKQMDIDRRHIIRVEDIFGHRHLSRMQFEAVL